VSTKPGQLQNAFLRAGASPSDRNLVTSYIDGGLGLKAPLPGRDDDVLTFGFAYSKISPDAAALDVDTQFFTGGFVPVRDHEFVLELDYSLQLAPWWTFQADLQQIIHPAATPPTRSMGRRRSRTRSSRPRARPSSSDRFRRWRAPSRAAPSWRRAPHP
jgi:carbohydrate-selective porin OprB